MGMGCNGAGPFDCELSKAQIALRQLLSCKRGRMEAASQAGCEGRGGRYKGLMSSVHEMQVPIGCHPPTPY